MHRVERISWPPVMVYVNPNEKLGEGIQMQSMQ
jgi:hypothetical protein